MGRTVGTFLLTHGRTIICSTEQALHVYFQQNHLLHFVFLVWEIHSRQIEAIFVSSDKQPQSGEQLMFGFHRCPVQNHIISPVLTFILNILSTNNCWFKSRKCCFVFPADWFLCQTPVPAIDQPKRLRDYDVGQSGNNQVCVRNREWLESGHEQVWENEPKPVFTGGNLVEAAEVSAGLASLVPMIIHQSTCQPSKVGSLGSAGLVSSLTRSADCWNPTLDNWMNENLDTPMLTMLFLSFPIKTSASDAEVFKNNQEERKKNFHKS